MFLYVVPSPPPDRHALARHVRAMHDRDRDSKTMSAGCSLAGSETRKVVSSARRTGGVCVIDRYAEKPTLGAMNPVVASDKLKRTEVWAEDDESVHWAGAFAVYGGHGATASSTIVYEIEPGKRLGWHTDATEETQYIIAGSGELHMEDGSTYRVGPGSVFAIPTPVKHDLVNVGKETLRAVAFFAAAMFTQNFDNVMMPPKSHILGSPNREG